MIISAETLNDLGSRAAAINTMATTANRIYRKIIMMRVWEISKLNDFPEISHTLKNN
jgi:hypothetical protein